MPTTQEIAMQMRNFGNLDPTRNDPANANNNGKKSEWEKLLAQMAMAQKMDARTMAGFALGKLLRQIFDNWKERYDARGDLNNRNNSNGGLEDAIKRTGWTPQQSADDGLARAAQRLGWTQPQSSQPQSTDSAPVNIDWLGQGDTNSPSPLANWRQQADNAVLPIPQLLDSDKMAQTADQLQFENLPWWLTGVR